MSKIILETERLILREYEQKDFDALFPILSDPETMKYCTPIKFLLLTTV